MATFFSISPVEATDQLGSYIPSRGMFPSYFIENKYDNDQHTYMMGITSTVGNFSRNSAAFVQLAKPTLLWTADWTVCKWGEQPEIPDPYSVGSQWVLLDIGGELAMITISPDGVTPLYRISGTYLFGIRTVGNNAFASMAFPVPPWLAGSFPRTIPLERLKSGLLKGNG